VRQISLVYGRPLLRTTHLAGRRSTFDTEIDDVTSLLDGVAAVTSTSDTSHGRRASNMARQNQRVEVHNYDEEMYES